MVTLPFVILMNLYRNPSTTLHTPTYYSYLSKIYYTTTKLETRQPKSTRAVDLLAMNKQLLKLASLRIIHLLLQEKFSRSCHGKHCTS